MEAFSGGERVLLHPAGVLGQTAIATQRNGYARAPLSLAFQPSLF